MSSVITNKTNTYTTSAQYIGKSTTTKKKTYDITFLVFLQPWKVNWRMNTKKEHYWYERNTSWSVVCLTFRTGMCHTWTRITYTSWKRNWRRRRLSCVTLRPCWRRASQKVDKSCSSDSLRHRLVLVVVVVVLQCCCWFIVVLVCQKWRWYC